jgi:pSer/pThr/pTyr-binding forkhead associated (FHA) protein
MIECPSCHRTHPVGMLFCPECGAYLASGSRTRTDRLAGNEAEQTVGTMPLEVAPPMTKVAEQVMVAIDQTGRQVELAPAPEARIGRLDPTRGIYPDLDLTPDGGLEHGVSRLHAIIRRDDRGIFLIDLDSINGTMINGRRLPPHQPYPLHTGDEVRLGRLVMHVHFDE